MARPASDPHLPRPKTVPRARESQAASREAGGRQADGLARRRLGLAAGRRASCRGRENGGAARTRSSPGLAAVRVPRTHHPFRPDPHGVALTCEASEPQPQRGRNTPLGGPGHTDPAPKVPGPGRRPPRPRTHTHTPGTFGTSDRLGSVPHPTHTHSLWVLRAASPPAKLPTRNPHAHSSFSNLISPGTRSFPPHS